MKKKPPADDEFDRHFLSLMKRLKAAGMIRSYSSTRTPCVEWNKDFRAPLGGRAAFVGMAMLLAEICQDEALSRDEQALIQMISQAEEETPSREI